MKLAEAIEFATTHANFNNFLSNHRIDPDKTLRLTAQIVAGPDVNNFAYLQIYLDFGAPGPGLGEIQILIRYDKHRATFIFDNIGMLSHGLNKANWEL